MSVSEADTQDLRGAPSPDASFTNALLHKLKRRVTLSHLVPAFVHEVEKVLRQNERLEWRLQRLHRACGRVERRQTADAPTLQEAEFQVFSQWGEDGAIQWLLGRVPVERRFFVEFGVEAYDEANTRFLLTDCGWSGLIIDSDPDQVAIIHQNNVYWNYDLRAVASLVTAQNMNQLLEDQGAVGDIGLLSIDIDGMDWHVWRAITVAQPRVVICEYNSLFGADRAVTVPYDPFFDRRSAHHSLCYYGASLGALVKLAGDKGYDLVGCGTSGLNAFFVRRDVRPASVPPVSAREAFIPGSFCEYHDEGGQRKKMSRQEMVRLVTSLPLQEV